MKKSIVLKVGGSIFYDPLLNINFELFRRIKKWYEEIKTEYDKVILVTGGGGLSRNMHEKIAGSIGGEDNIHDISMSITQTNASILAAYLDDKEIFVPKKLGDAYEFLLSDDGKYMVSGGLKIGWSTDMDAAVFADVLDTGRVYKISNIDFIYDKDPKEFFEALPIRDMSWEEYFQMFSILPGQNNKPNAHIPIDVQCSIFCERKNLSFHITGGKLLEEIEDIKGVLNEGTYVHP
jgi:uridylate kinase